MRMVHQVLSPRMEDAYETDPSAYTVVPKLHECLGDRAKEEAVGNLLVSEYQWVQLRRNGEDQMEVVYGQEVLTPGLYPLLFLQELALWTVTVSTGVIRHP